jgi:hypothetical protein
MDKPKDWIDGEVQTFFRLGRRSGLKKADLLRRFQDGEPLANLVPQYLDTPGGATALRMVSARLQQAMPLSSAQVAEKRQTQESTVSGLSAMLQVLNAWESLPEPQRLPEAWYVQDRLARILWGIQC